MNDNAPPIQVVIMDIDGTLANAEHRLHLLPANRPDYNRSQAWDEFLGAAHGDTLNREIAILNNAMHEVALIFVVTGRKDSDRDITEQWLLKHGIRHDRLYMRAANDRREDTVVKREVLDAIRAEGFEVLFAVEDRASVTKMWRDSGVRCLQVCEGGY